MTQRPRVRRLLHMICHVPRPSGPWTQGGANSVVALVLLLICLTSRLDYNALMVSVGICFMHRVKAAIGGRWLFVPQQFLTVI